VPAKAAHGVSRGADLRPRHEPPGRGFPWHFAARAAAVVTGLALLLVVNVKGVVFYLAWGLIGLALLTEAAATLVYWRRSRD
jgi:hypothetical protein